MKFSTGAPKRRVIVHADDFGIAEEQSRRIVDCAAASGKGGALNSLSVMVTSPRFRECARMLRPLEGGLLIGLHVNLVEGHCAADAERVPLLVDADGVFKRGFGGLLLLSLLKRDDVRAQATEEISAQLDAFLQEFPQMKDALRVDSHQHFHMIPAVFDALVAAIEERGCAVEYVRVPAEPLIPFVRARALHMAPPINWVKNAVLNTLWQFNKGKVAGLRERSAVFCGINFSGCMTREHVGRVLQEFKRYAAAKGRPVEFLFHPGGVGDAAECLNPALSGFVAFYTSPNRKAEANAVFGLAAELAQDPRESLVYFSYSC